MVELDAIPQNAFFIPGNTASSKNSKQWTGKRLIWSKSASQYRTNTTLFWQAYASKFRKAVAGKQKPILLGIYFVRDSHRKFDFVNPTQTIQDLMVMAGWIEDDNIDEIIPVPIRIKGVFYHVDKSNPGVYIIPL